MTTATQASAPRPLARAGRRVVCAAGAVVPVAVVVIPVVVVPVAVAPVAAQAPSTDVWVATFEPRDGAFTFAAWSNVTDREGYDNQPSFTPDGRALLFTSDRGGQTDTYRYELASRHLERVTSTPESEYSPTVMPGGERFSAVRVEADSTQRLWSFRLDGTDPRLVLPHLAPVGYHAWVDAERLVLYVLGPPSTLHLASPGSTETRVWADSVGRSLQRVPGRAAVSFVDQSEEPWWIATLDADSGMVRRVAPMPSEVEDHAWTPDGVLLVGRESRLYALDPGRDTGWREIADLSAAGIQRITRIAVSPDGRRIAVVAARPEPAATP